MKTQRLLTALLLTGLAMGARAESAARIEFTGDSTLHGFSGHAESTELAWQRGADDTLDVALRVSAGALTTDLSARDKNMWRMLDAAGFPQLAGTLDHLPAAWLNAPQAEPLTRPLTLTIRDRTLNLPAQVRLLRDETNALLDVSFTVSLDAYGLRPPNVLGLIRVRDTVQVHVQIPVLSDKDSSS